MNFYMDFCMRAALRLPPDQRQNPPALPMHLVDVLGGGGGGDGGVQAFPEASGNIELLFVQA